MKYDPNKHPRHSIRLKGYDYTQPGAYFVTICTGECLFGDIANPRMQLSRFGETVQSNWDYLPNRHPHIQLHAFVIMPNHLHGIIILTDEPVFSPKHHGLPEIIRGFKTSSARRINQLRSLKYVPVWQRNYYEHIIRSEDTGQKIREYILNNPLAWDRDEFPPGNPFPFSRQISLPNRVESRVRSASSILAHIMVPARKADHRNRGGAFRPINFRTQIRAHSGGTHPTDARNARGKVCSWALAQCGPI